MYSTQGKQVAMQNVLLNLLKLKYNTILPYNPFLMSIKGDIILLYFYNPGNRNECKV